MSRPAPSTPLPAASPAAATAPSHRDAIASAHPADQSPADALDSSVALFSRHYNVAAGDVFALSPSSSPRRRALPSSADDDAQKRIRSPAARSGASAPRTPSGRPRKRATRPLPPSSPRRAARAISTAVASAVAVVMPPAAVPTPSPRASSVADVFETPVVVRKRWGDAMIGHVPKAGFLKWMRPKVFPWKKMGRPGTTPVLVSPTVPTYTPSQIAADCRRCRSYMLHDFAWYGGRSSAADSPEVDDFATPNGRTTRSSVAKEEEWALDEEAFSVATTDRRRLSRLPIESLVVAGTSTKMVLLVSARDDGILMGNKAHRIDDQQGHARTFISRKEFITLQCHISECRQR